MGALGDGLRRYQKKGFRSFHTPGHKGRKELLGDINFPEYDLTELPGLDMLHNSKGIIAEAQENAARIFGAEESFFLVNGGTAGNQAMFLSLNPTDKRPVLAGRQSHRSVLSAFVLSGRIPEYVQPILHPDFNLPLGFDGKDINSRLGLVSGIHITYPSYYGTLPDLKEIIVEKNKLGLSQPVMVDQAHGSHYLGRFFPPSALVLGADVVLHSTHKTLGALTQAGMLHVQGENISRARLRQSLEMLQSSSPSYLLMASLERASESALADTHWQALYEEIECLHNEVGDSLRLLSSKDENTYGISRVDWSKILLNVRSIGMHASECVNYLRTEFGIEPELWDEENILFVLGIGNTVEDVRRLSHGLKNLADFSARNKTAASIKTGFREIPPVPPLKMSPREAFFAHKKQVRLKDSLGHVCGETISPYPPGIPLVVMGEEITPEIYEVLVKGVAGQWQGWDDYSRGMIWIVEEG